MRQVAFRTDASVQIGTGHVMRCLTLAKALRAKGAFCRFFMRELPGHAGGVVASAGFDVTLLRAPAPGETNDTKLSHGAWLGVPQSVDAAETGQKLAQSRPDWLVVDHYALDQRWQSAMRGLVGRIMVIDDLADRVHDADLLLDQNLGRSSADYDGLLPAGCIRLIGPRFALLRPEFAAAREAALTRRAHRGATLGRQLSILLAMGGIDKDDATGQVLRALQTVALPADIEVTVVLGGQAPHLARVRELAQGLPFPVSVEVDVADMARLMSASDLAIGASGSTSWERCCLGLPTLLLTLADNQLAGAAALEKAGAAVLLGDVRQPGWQHHLQHQITGLLSSMEKGQPTRLPLLSKAAAAVTDGTGVARVAAMMTAGHLHVRRAGLADAQPIWAWRHAEGATRYYASGRTIPLSEHLEWFERALRDPSKLMLVVYRGAVPAGHVRFDRDPDTPSRATISIVLDSSVRGQGLARPLIEAAQSYAVTQGVEHIHAQVHAENAPSLRLFSSVGYREIRQQGSFLDLELVVGDCTPATQSPSAPPRQE